MGYKGWTHKDEQGPKQKGGSPYGRNLPDAWRRYGNPPIKKAKRLKGERKGYNV